MNVIKMWNLKRAVRSVNYMTVETGMCGKYQLKKWLDDKGFTNGEQQWIIKHALISWEQVALKDLMTYSMYTTDSKHLRMHLERKGYSASEADQVYVTFCGMQ